MFLARQCSKGFQFFGCGAKKVDWDKKIGSAADLNDRPEEMKMEEAEEDRVKITTPKKEINSQQKIQFKKVLEQLQEQHEDREALKKRNEAAKSELEDFYKDVLSDDEEFEYKPENPSVTKIGRNAKDF